MKASEIDERNVSDALEQVEQFMQRNPQFDGSELSANLMYERISRDGRELTADTLESTWHELASEGLLNDGVDYGTDNPVNDLLEPVQDERKYKVEDDDETEVIEYAWHDDPEPDYNSLSTKEVHDLLKRHEKESAPEMTLEQQIDALSTAQLGQLIVRAGKR